MGGSELLRNVVDTAHLDMIRFSTNISEIIPQKNRNEKLRQSVTSDQQKYRNFLKKNKKLSVGYWELPEVK